MQIRTDLALEISEARGKVRGLTRFDRSLEGGHLSRIEIKTEEAARLMSRDPGTYVTLELPKLTDNDSRTDYYATVLAEELRKLLPSTGTVLVVGLGNRQITPDTVGPRTADKVLATRHIRKEWARTVGLDSLRPTVVLSPGVTGQTGAETGELVGAVCRELKPSAVIAVDALAARSLSRLGCTVQLCDTGISPGSGVGNDRKALNRTTLGVPVIGVGVPTVVDARTLAVELTGCYDPELLEPSGTQMVITPREIDLLVIRAAKLLSLAINGALQPDYAPAELIGLCE